MGGEAGEVDCSYWYWVYLLRWGMRGCVVVVGGKSEGEVKVPALEPGLDFCGVCAGVVRFEEGCGWGGVGCVY